MQAVEKIYTYLFGMIALRLWFKVDQALLEIFVDADWAGDANTSQSTIGWIFQLSGSPIYWAAKRQKTVALSVCEAEHMAMTEAAKEAR